MLEERKILTTKTKKMKTKTLFKIARSLPRSIIYWCGIVLWANATQNEYSDTEAPAIRMDEVLRRWKN
jgi:hypothetical protein